jgi:hypothetical protein
MVTKGAFGYIIGKKKRLMPVNDDADLLWQILVRETFILLSHYKTKEELQKAFEQIEVAKPKNKPKENQIEKCKCFADLERNEIGEWDGLLKYCQSSFINILEAGYFLNEKIQMNGYIFILDFNKGEVIYHFKDWEGKINHMDSAKLEEIMLFDEMPTKNYTEIVDEMREQFNIYYENLMSVRTEIDKLDKLLIETKRQCAANIEEKIDKLLYEMKTEEKKIHMGRRMFYNRLKALDLIENT